VKSKLSLLQEHKAFKIECGKWVEHQDFHILVNSLASKLEPGVECLHTGSPFSEGGPFLLPAFHPQPTFSALWSTELPLRTSKAPTHLDAERET
jgi:hypothetical protein